MRETQPQMTRELEALFDRYRADPGGRVFAPLADACRKAGLVEEAIEIVDRGIGAHPDYAVGHVVRGKCYFDHGDVETARAAFERVLELDANNLVALKYLGIIHADAGRASRAREYFRHILVLDPDDLDIAGRLEALGEADVAKAPEASDDDFAPATIRLGEEDDEAPDGRNDAEELATMTLADIYASQGYTERALRIYHEILRRQPDHAEARRRIRELKGRGSSAAGAAPGDAPRSDASPRGEREAGEREAGEDALVFEDVVGVGTGDVQAHRADGEAARTAPDSPREGVAGSPAATPADANAPVDGSPPRARPLDESRSYEQFKRWLRNLAD